MSDTSEAVFIQIGNRLFRRQDLRQIYIDDNLDTHGEIVVAMQVLDPNGETTSHYRIVWINLVGHLNLKHSQFSDTKPGHGCPEKYEKYVEKVREIVFYRMSDLRSLLDSGNSFAVRPQVLADNALKMFDSQMAGFLESKDQPKPPPKPPKTRRIKSTPSTET